MDFNIIYWNLNSEGNTASVEEKKYKWCWDNLIAFNKNK